MRSRFEAAGERLRLSESWWLCESLVREVRRIPSAREPRYRRGPGCKNFRPAGALHDLGLLGERLHSSDIDRDLGL